MFKGGFEVGGSGGGGGGGCLDIVSGIEQRRKEEANRYLTRSFSGTRPSPRRRFAAVGGGVGPGCRRPRLETSARRIGIARLFGE